MEFPQYIQMMLSMLDKIPREYYRSTDGGMYTDFYDPHKFACEMLLLFQNQDAL